MKKHTIYGQKYLTLSWDETNEQLLQIAEKIIKKKEKFDRVVALAKGGLTWSRTLCDYLGIKELSSIQISFYTGIASTQKTPVITQSLPIAIQNERILIFDDVADSGETLVLAKKYIKMHGAKTVKTATVAIKSWTSFVPDYYGFNSSEWIIFPHEIRETMTLLKRSWKKQHISDAVVKKHLTSLGMSAREIAVFYNLV